MRKLVAAADDECREGIALIQARRRKRSDSPHRISGAIVGMGRPTIRHTPLTIALDRLIVTHVVVAACLVIHARYLACYIPRCGSARRGNRRPIHIISWRGALPSRLHR